MDGLREEVGGQVLHLDLLSEFGGEVARRYGVRAVPETLLFDGDGRVVMRQSGVPDAEAFRAALK